MFKGSKGRRKEYIHLSESKKVILGKYSVFLQNKRRFTDLDMLFHERVIQIHRKPYLVLGEEVLTI